VLAAARPVAPLGDAVAQLERLHALLHDRPPPPESLGSMQLSAATASAPSSSSSDAAEPSHRCAKCAGAIHNDLRRAMAGSGEVRP